MFMGCAVKMVFAFTARNQACICPDGFNRNDPSDWSKGCSPSFNLTCDPSKLDFMQLNNTDFLDMTWLPMMDKADAIRKPRKVGTTDLNCSNEALAEGGKTSKKSHIKYLIAFVGAFAVIEISCIGLAWWYVFRKHMHEELANMGQFVLAMGFKLYKGVLEDERVIAVKRLGGVLQGDAEFWAEVTIIGKINHRNLVKLWGFCAENEHKLLVYEYVENGSLDKILFSDSASKLDWNQRYNIAVGTAKGLSYLHEECLEWVLHCDVKPQNILLDDHLEPKVADFGLSKLFKDQHDTGFSKVRGTRGYLAPEWMMNQNIDAKADVYSYGVVLLELLSGKTASDFQSATPHDECNNLVQWATKQHMTPEGPRKVIDPRLKNESYEEKIDRMIEVALLCVAEDRHSRPPMSKVVELLTAYGVSNPAEKRND
ncbi:hypothetical protein Patl1_31786 [Pistacia atlantica]|uniref:Uncharacterized protein n=1 Tax=Pistacia atlantica TaxID=434234 RepID=A0ACC1APN2_9ROSI|nr:hypothetical protein Patl1_31786 [Pistacia atlantica]